MKVKFIFFLLLFISLSSNLFAKDDLIGKLKKIQNVPYIPEYSGDSIYWEIVKNGLEIVPHLINFISDSTVTEINVPNFGGFYTIGDLSFSILSKIIHDIPVFSLLKIDKKIVEEIGFGAYWNFVRSEYKNRILFKEKISRWYYSNKDNLIWKTDDREFKGGTHNFPRKNPAGGYYILNKPG